MLISEQTVIDFLKSVSLGEYNTDELVKLFKDYIKIESDSKLEYTIEPYQCLPCSLSKFEINGIRADVEDFGETNVSGDCMEGTCHSWFTPKLPVYEVLHKYGINLDGYSKICEDLEDKLYVGGCGWCS